MDKYRSCDTQKTHVNAYFFGARNYNPGIGRWMVPDPMAEMYANSSPYNYVNNSPINNYDPNGMWWSDDLSKEEMMGDPDSDFITWVHEDGSYETRGGGYSHTYYFSGGIREAGPSYEEVQARKYVESKQAEFMDILIGARDFLFGLRIRMSASKTKAVDLYTLLNGDLGSLTDAPWGIRMSFGISLTTGLNTSSLIAPSLSQIARNMMGLYKYKSEREKNWLFNKYKDCSEFLYNVMLYKDKEMAKAWWKDGGMNSTRIIDYAKNNGGFHQIPKANDIAMWNGHVAIVSEVNGNYFKIIHASGYEGKVVPYESGVDVNGVWWLNTKHYSQGNWEWGDGTFLGFWTPNYL